MKQLIILFILVGSIVFFPNNANADTSRICTRTQGSRVTLRTGPGTNYSRGLVEVGSGGNTVDEYFRQRNYTIANGEQVSIFSSTRGTDGYTWYRVGTNQWVAWVRSDFVCRR